MKETDVAWLAGLLEGEGSFVVRPKNTPYISLKMNDFDIVERAATMLGTSTPTRKNNYKTTFGIDKCWTIQAYDRNVLLVLIPKMMSYFGERRKKQAQRLLDVCTRRKEFEADFFQKVEFLRALNCRGFTWAGLSRMTGHAPSTIRKWVMKAIPSVVQTKGYDWGR